MKTLSHPWSAVLIVGVIANFPSVASAEAPAPQAPEVSAQALDPDVLYRAPGASARTPIDEIASKETAGKETAGKRPDAQYFFLHDDNFFAFKTNGGWPALVKFQVSVRFEAMSFLKNHFFGLNLAFTQKSFWNVFDQADSNPVLENNYRPEAFLSFRPDKLQRFREIQLGYQHESNGLGKFKDVDASKDSRGWNYVFADARWWIPRVYPGSSWLLLTPGVRAWYPFWASAGIVDALGYVSASLDLEARLPQHPWVTRISNRIKVQRHSVQDDLYYPILPLAFSDHVRLWIVLQYFHGRGESLLSAPDDANEFYAGIGFQ
jgi:outer membrane phospholipase A